MVTYRCHGCGAVVDVAAALPFRCPGAGADDTDHVLVPQGGTPAWPDDAEANPYLRYRAMLSPYRLAREAGLSDAAWTDLVGSLDTALVAVDGRGFVVTPLAEERPLASALGLTRQLWVKDETGNVAGSHKARHLIGVMLYLRVVEVAELPVASGLRARRLAIASCGNAAIAAAVVARAADRPLDVFIPPEASETVVATLRDLGAAIAVCERRAGERGDPCVLRFREAVAAGAIPFGVQGCENGLAVEGGRTIGFELADGFAAAGIEPEAILVQVGGGALASAVSQGLHLARAAGRLAHVPKLIAVQAEGCAPLARAWQRLEGIDLAAAARRRSNFMWPWESVPASLAGGILDDETYDWWEVANGMRASGGSVLVADEGELARAHAAARAATGIPVSPTGSAGLAGASALASAGAPVAVIFSGRER
jgi:threonine synthase